MKRLTAIIHCKKLTDVLDRKAKRLMRQVEQAIDAAKDAAADTEDKIEEKINSLGLVAGADQTQYLQTKLNECIDLYAEWDSYIRSVEYLERIKATLNEDVEIEDDSDPEQPVKTRKVSK